MRRRLPFYSHPLAKHFKMVTSNKTVTETITPSSDQIEALSARGYQTEVVEQAKQENLIVCLPTGSGKTYIAVMLIKEMSHSVRESLSKGGKRTIFLVNTVQLVEQQSEYIRKHTDLTVGIYYGELGVDLWKKDQWDIEFENHQVLVFTAQVFLNLIDHDIFSLNNVNLIIFDECHHASGDNRYAALMSKHYDKCSHPPRVLGLTASLSSKKIRPKNLADIAKELERIYRARIASGSSRKESVQHGTCVHVETIRCASYQDEILNTHESLTIPFDFLRFMINTIQSYLSKQKDEYSKIEADLGHTMLTTDYRGENIANYHRQSSDYTSFTQSQSITIVSLKRYLENLVEVGHELGLAGLYLFAKELRRKLKLPQTRLSIPNPSARELFEDVFQRLECLVDDILEPLYQSNVTFEILFSPKVIKLVERIVEQQEIKGSNSKCIVFVERVYTATMLSQVLSDFIPCLESPWDTQLKAKHITGIKAIFSDKPMTAKYQHDTIKEFRSGSVNILIATAVVEEGLDIPQCDLVIRFNKPHNFSSYMQSKGRARAKQNASYVLFMGKSDDAYQQDKMEYDNYEEIEKMIQEGFSSDESDGNLDNDLKQIPPYRPSKNVTIDATRAAQLIMEYCVLLGNGQIFPPRFLFHGHSSPYTCILSMPANCPIRDDVICKNEKKKLAKYECCLEMVKKLHQKGEFDEHCLPSRHRTALKIDIPIENRIFKLCDQLFEDKSDSSFEIFTKQLGTFPAKSDLSSTNWYLYQINNQLGFVVPCELIKLPKFHIYGPNEIIKIGYLKRIDYQSYRKQLEDFCRYVFEYVFEEMNIETILKFDIENSTFKLLPCLLTKSGEIDSNRMMIICNRKNKSVENYSELNDNELYWPLGLSRKQLYMNISDPSKLKRASDPWDHGGDMKTYGDYFESKQSDVRIRRDSYLATMKGFKKAKINYLKDSSTSKKEKLIDDSKESIYYPIEYLRYAPLNQQDLESISKLPSILIRISQLYRIEKLRKLFAENKKLLDVDQMPPVAFHDCLKSSVNPSLLPLIPLTYNNLASNDDFDFQLSSDILFQAITRRSADENVDMENLEILGDCFLKLTVSMCLYHRYPLAGAGALTIEKGKQISNGNLYRIAVLKRLKSYLNAMKINIRGEDANWIPPGYLITNESELKRYKTQKVKRKAFADMIEAFIGAFLISTNYSTTIQFMKWLGLDVIPEDTKIPSIVCSSIGDGEIDSVVNRFYKEQDFYMIEKTIHHEFKNKAYLIAAFTHPSSFANRLTNCYERLEFLGDAVLDFLVTQHIFIKKKDITPGRVTDIRQDLSNNGRLAYILVACRLQTKILHNSPDLFGKISVYAGDEDLFPKDSSIEIKLNKGIDQWADSTAPKALADVFEALVGAIFLDSGKCLKTVWKVIEPLLQEYLDQSITDPNLNPVRWFFEQGGKVIQEGTITDPKTKNTISICMIEAANGYYIKGYGSNRKMAKFDACRTAIKLSIA